jgi:hypothetical protein
LINSFLEKREKNALGELALRSADQEQDFRVFHSGWERKTVPFEIKTFYHSMQELMLQMGIMFC